MQLVNATGLAQALGVSKARVSQYVGGGKLEGCYRGDGRERRFDVALVRKALLGQLDPGQMMGNGAATRAMLQGGDAEPDEADLSLRELPAPTRDPKKQDGALAKADPDRYTLARTQVAEEEARTKRRQNMQAEGQFVLASEVERVTAQMVAQEVAEFESVLRRIARRLADVHGLDFKVVRQMAIEEWRSHRGDRATALTEKAGSAGLDDAEKAADF